MADKIGLNNMIFYGYHGVLPAETELGQRFEADVALELDLAHAGKTDDLSFTVNYAEVYDVVKVVMEKERFKLLEKVAEEIAARILKAFAVQAVTVTIRKPSAPIIGVLDNAEVTIRRKKNS